MRAMKCANESVISVTETLRALHLRVAYKVHLWASPELHAAYLHHDNRLTFDVRRDANRNRPIG